MKVLIVAATAHEIAPLLQKYKINPPGTGLFPAAGTDDPELAFLITGVGMVNTTYHLTRHLIQSNPDICINAGIAGSFRDEIKIGEVVCVQEDRFADMGAENGKEFITIDEMGLGEQAVRGAAPNRYSGPGLEPLRLVKAISVNKVHGHEDSIRKVVERFNPDIESMEGAAFMLTCMNEKIRHVQLRSISNRVERRNRDKWNIPLAVKNLNDFLVELIPTFTA